MKIQTRFFFLVVTVFAILIGVLFIQRSLDLESSNQVLQTTLEERKQSFDVSLESEGEIFKTFITDYSFWDEMVDFVKTGNKEFAANNLETGLDTYKANALWVYNPNGKLVYSKSSDPDKPLNPVQLPADFFTRLSKDKFTNFYIDRPEGILEVRAATIVPGDDPEHNNPPEGYLIIGRYLGDEFIEKMQTLSQSEVKFEPPTSPAEDIASGDTVSFSIPMKNISDETIQLLNSKSEVAVVKALNASYSKQLLLLIGAGLMILVIIMSGLWLFVLRPIQIISKSIQTKDSSMLDKMAKSRSQFGELAKVVQEFFRQKLAIQEAENKQAELEKLNKEKTAFLSAAAHELKAPGTIIALVSESLSKDARSGKSLKVISGEVDTITNQARKMTALVTDLRSAAEGKKMTTRKDTIFDFDDFLNREVRELGYVIEQKIILTGKTNKKLQTDELHLGQVVSNLIRNAAKYSPADKVILVKSSVKKGDIIVEFADQGVGISKADQRHLFEKYFRAENVKSSVEGLGLGLSICYDIISGMGGKLWVESELGKGSHFFFSLPINKLSPKVTDSKNTNASEK